MSEPLQELVAQYIAGLARENASKHTVRNYASDLEAWVGFLTPPGGEAPAIGELDPLVMREWLGSLYDNGLQTASVRRKLAAVRSFLKWAERRGLVVSNVARVVRTPKLPQVLPHVPAPETANQLLEEIPRKGEQTERPHVARDLAIFELLYGCGLRISELVGLNLSDVEPGSRWLKVLG